MKKVSTAITRIVKWLELDVHPTYPMIPLNKVFELYEYDKQRSMITDMYQIIDEATDIEAINPEDSIIICDDGKSNNFRSDDGKFIINSSGPIDPTIGRVLFNGNISEYIYMPRLKISIPYSIDMDFIKPENTTFHNQIYSQFDKINYGIQTPMNPDSEDITLPTHKVYYNFKFTIYFDLFRLRNDFKIAQLTKITPLLAIRFIPYNFIGQPDRFIEACSKVYYIKNIEIFRNFNEIFK